MKGSSAKSWEIDDKNRKSSKKSKQNEQQQESASALKSVTEWVSNQAQSVAQRIYEFTDGVVEEDVSTRYERAMDETPRGKRGVSPSSPRISSRPSLGPNCQRRQQSSGFFADARFLACGDDEASWSAVQTVEGKPDLSDSTAYTNMMNEILARGESMEAPAGTTEFKEGMNRYLTVYLQSRELTKKDFMEAIQKRFKKMTIYPEPFEAPEVRATRKVATMLQLQIKGPAEPDENRKVFFSSIVEEIPKSSTMNTSKVSNLESQKFEQSPADPAVPSDAQSSPDNRSNKAPILAYETQYFDNFYQPPSAFASQPKHHQENNTLPTPTPQPQFIPSSRPNPYFHNPGDMYFRNDRMNYYPPPRPLSPQPMPLSPQPMPSPPFYELPPMTPSATYPIISEESTRMERRYKSRQQLMAEIIDTTDILDATLDSQMRMEYERRLAELKYDLLILSNTKGEDSSPERVSDFHLHARRKSLVSFSDEKDDEDSENEVDNQVEEEEYEDGDYDDDDDDDDDEDEEIGMKTAKAVAVEKIGAATRLSQNETTKQTPVLDVAEKIDSKKSVESLGSTTTSDKKNSLLKKTKKGVKVVMVRAPQTLPEDYTFEAEVEGKVMMIKIPKGGVKKGQVFEHVVEMDAQMSVPIGKWRTGGLVASFFACKSFPFTINSIICPQSESTFNGYLPSDCICLTSA